MILDSDKKIPKNTFIKKIDHQTNIFSIIAIFFIIIATGIFFARRNHLISKEKYKCELFPNSKIFSIKNHQINEIEILYNKIQSLDLIEIEYIIKKFSFQGIWNEECNQLIKFLNKKSEFFSILSNYVESKKYIVTSSDNIKRQIILDCYHIDIARLN